MFSHADQSSKERASTESRPPVKFGACTDRWGNAVVGLHRVGDWDPDLAVKLVEKCEETYQKEKAHQQWRPTPETASERM